MPPWSPRRYPSMSEVGRHLQPHHGQLVRRHLLIGGKVQGVGFRVLLADQAITARLTGSVRNLDDGRVEAALEGPRDAVDHVAAWCREGPTMAHVSAIEITDEDLTGDREFAILE
jgi:acylphosphatase